MVSLALIGTLSWCILYSIVGETAAPGGHLFQLILLSICAHFGGWLMSLTTLPALIGMLFTGLIFQNVGVVDIDESFAHITKELR
jgi:Kef-type K+ transport system membrane component KefB